MKIEVEHDAWIGLIGERDHLLGQLKAAEHDIRQLRQIVDYLIATISKTSQTKSRSKP